MGLRWKIQELIIFLQEQILEHRFGLEPLALVFSLVINANLQLNADSFVLENY